MDRHILVPTIVALLLLACEPPVAEQWTGRWRLDGVDLGGIRGTVMLDITSDLAECGTVELLGLGREDCATPVACRALGSDNLVIEIASASCQLVASGAIELRRVDGATAVDASRVVTATRVGPPSIPALSLDGPVFCDCSCFFGEFLRDCNESCEFSEQLCTPDGNWEPCVCVTPGERLSCDPLTPLRLMDTSNGCEWRGTEFDACYLSEFGGTYCDSRPGFGSETDDSCRSNAECAPGSMCIQDSWSDGQVCRPLCRTSAAQPCGIESPESCVSIDAAYPLLSELELGYCDRPTSTGPAGWYVLPTPDFVPSVPLADLPLNCSSFPPSAELREISETLVVYRSIEGEGVTAQDACRFIGRECVDMCKSGSGGFSWDCAEDLVIRDSAVSVVFCQ